MLRHSKINVHEEEKAIIKSIVARNEITKQKPITNYNNKLKNRHVCNIETGFFLKYKSIYCETEKKVSKIENVERFNKIVTS